MSPASMKLVCDSWATARPVADRITRLFFRRLLELSPEARKGYNTSFSERAVMMIQAIDTSVDRLASASDFERTPAEKIDESIVEAWVWSLRGELPVTNRLEVENAWSALLRSSIAAEFHAAAIGVSVVG